MKVNHFFYLIVVSLFLSGCVSPKVYMGENVELKNYTEVYFIQLDEDPRNVGPQVISEFENLGLNVHIVTPDNPIEGAQGTGFLVSNDGHILTCAHILGEQKDATIWIQGKRFEADVTAIDEELDLALLVPRGPLDPSILPLKFRDSEQTKMGEDIYTIGYPISNLLGKSARLSKGLVSATKGLEDDPNQLQISAEIQPGNSGGPLFDEKGQVIAVVQQTLNPLAMYQQTGGALPQNVNFGIKSNIATAFIQTHAEIDNEALIANETFDFELIEKSVVKIRSGIMPEALEQAPKLVAAVNYHSFWDLWFRFRYFVVSFYDYDTQKFLFRAGQFGDNLGSSEGKSISDTFLKIKETLAKAK